jgi:hypothetical protein
VIAGKKADQILLRLPPGLKARVAERAESTGRSMNAEIVVAIQKHLQRGSRLEVLWQEREQRMVP